MSGVTITEMSRRLLKAQREQDKPLFNSLRKTIRAARTAAGADIASRGIGRRIWGKKRKGLAGQIKTIRITRHGDVIKTGYNLTGLVAEIELGGRTKPHTIKPKLAKRLVFQGKGRTVFARSVSHPGGPIAKREPVSRAVRAAQGDLIRDVEASLAAHYQKGLD